MKNKPPYEICKIGFAVAVLLWIVASSATKESLAQNKPAGDIAFVAKVCERLEEEAGKWSVPRAFFARLIWKESRFDPDAISPKGAEGIAQFMPATARLRELAHPFDTNSAIAASASYLSDLRNEFGNWGLAAAAYNAGEDRVDRWRAGKTGLPAETQDYVYSITGHRAKEWKRDTPPAVRFVLDEALPFQQACNQYSIIKAPNQRHFANTYFNRGLALTQQKKFVQAIARYSVAIRLKPIFPHAYNNRGIVYRKIGDHETAIANYDAAIRQNPKYAAAYNNRGYAKRKLGRLLQAIDDYDKAIKLEANYTAAHFNRGFAKAKLGRLKEAIRDYSVAIRLNPKHALALYNRAMAHLNSGNTELAEADLNRTIAAEPRFAKAYYRRATLLQSLGRKKRALKDYRSSVALNAGFARRRYKDAFE